jgi:hypothetical protein
MNEDEFAQLFRDALEKATADAEARLGRSLPRSYTILLHGAGHSGATMPIEQAAQVLYLGPECFYRIIDIALTKVVQDSCVVFVRVSGHAPGSWLDTWNDPPGSGPFKQLIAQDIEVS